VRRAPRQRRGEHARMTSDRSLLIGITGNSVVHSDADQFDLDTRFRMVREAGVGFLSIRHFSTFNVTLSPDTCHVALC
jgi:hypothetical protein